MWCSPWYGCVCTLGEYERVVGREGSCPVLPPSDGAACDPIARLTPLGYVLVYRSVDGVLSCYWVLKVLETCLRSYSLSFV